MNIITPIAPAQLWLGPHESLIAKVVTYLQAIYCEKNSCNVCIQCKNIKKQQHHAIMWLSPKKMYTLDQLAPISTTISFELEPDKKYFFIIQHAELLTPVCSNSLLKSMEEPPANYHFILLTHHSDQILPTVKSRCTITYNNDINPTILQHQLITFFTDENNLDPTAFLQALEMTKPTEHETIAILEHLMSFWIEKGKRALTKKDTTTLKGALIFARFFKKCIETPFIDATSKIFWKNCYLQFQKIKQ